MKKILSALGLFAIVAAVSAQDCSDLFISEYVEGSGNSKGVEIYNPTAEIVPLGAYYVARFSNGNTTYESGGITQLQGFLYPYTTHFLVNGQTVTTETSPACDPALQAMAQQLDHDYPAPTYMNGNDAIALLKDPVGSGNPDDYVLIDLMGIIGGGMQSSDEGWTDFTDDWAYKNIYEGEEITGQDSTFIQLYIVPDTYYWLTWTANHALVRKASVKGGVDTNPNPAFVVTTEWDTVPGGVDQWDFIGSHSCDCEPTNGLETGLEEDLLQIYPNPARDYFRVDARMPMEELILYDASGREIYRENHTSGILNGLIETDNFPAGLYQLKVSFKEHAQVKRVMIL
ncbi:MAG: lamin tail domain-containing protein [Bacteroides sp.]|nr:lamin tail domain-containing protein [Bacteroides sp.]